MSKYWIRYVDKGVLTYIELDATVSITETFGGSVTSNPIADKTVVADTFISRNPIFNLSGVITDVTQPFIRTVPITGEELRDTSTKSRTDLIKSTMKNGTIVELQSADELYSSCVITSVTLTKTAQEGIGGWKVDLELTKLNLVSALEVTLDEAPIDIFTDDFSKKSDSTSNTTKSVGELSHLTQVQGWDLNAKEFIGLDSEPVGG